MHTAAEHEPRRRGFDPARAARVIRRLVLPAAILGLLLLYWNFGLLRVPPGMDTTPDVPPGSLCVIDKRKGSVAPGTLVFVDVPGGGTLLSRVREVRDEEVVVRNDNPRSKLPDSEELGPLPLQAVRGIVLSAFPPDAREGLPRGR